jgi:hypothetical protein
MKKCLIHIGTHKTGTTSIQSFLYKNSESLKQKGIFYSSLVEENINAGHHAIAAKIAANKSSEVKRNRIRIQQLMKDIEESSCNSAIISSEIFSTIDPDLVRQTFAEFDCHIICFLRRQDDYLESMYREIIKNSEFFGSKAEFLDIVRTEKELELCAYQNKYNATLPLYYDRFLDKWADCFGKEKIHVRAYDEPNTNGDSIEAFLETIELSYSDFFDSEREHNNYNSSFKPEIIQFRNLIDRKLSFIAQSSLRDSVWWANNHFQKERPTYFFDTEERQKIMAIAAESNTALKAKYLPHSEAEWLDNCTVAEKAATPDLDIDTALQCMSLLIAHQASQLQHQAKQIAILQEEIARINSRKMAIIFSNALKK